jgi:5-methylthioadenosine/S-adenosylhomocysteine deaminase
MVTIVNADEEHLDAVVEAYDASSVRVSLALQIGDRAAVDTVPYWDELDPDLRQRFATAPKDAEALKGLIARAASSVKKERLTWGLAPSAPQRCSDSLLSWIAQMSHDHDMTVFTHLYEARNQAVLARTRYEGGSLLSHLEKFGLLNSRLTIAHGVWIDDEELARFGAAGASLAFNPASNLKLLNGAAPIRTYADFGANLAVGCDNCSGNDAQSIFQSMKMFALYWGMQSDAGEDGAAREAFRAATVGGARALGLEDRIGKIRTGYDADIVMLDLSTSTYRPLNSALRQIVYGETGQSIDTVIVGGKIVVKSGELVEHRAAALKDEAEEALARLRPELTSLAERNKAIVPHLLNAFNKAERHPLTIDRYRLRPACDC